ncbi:tail fiber protein, partial [Vreelandella titanicae]
ADSATAAGSSASAAATSESNAADSATAASSSASAAATSESNAADSATAAGSSASAAATSESNAADSATAASSSASAAATSESNAADSATAAGSSASAAATSESNAADSAAAADQSASAAETAKSDAENLYGDLAAVEAARDSAADSATVAGNSAAAAQDAANQLSGVAIGEVRMFTTLLLPSNWLICNGSELVTGAADTLRTQLIDAGYPFGQSGTDPLLPDLRGRSPVGLSAAGPLTDISLGAQRGAESVTLTTDNLPAHSHDYSVTVATDGAGESTPGAGDYLASGRVNLNDPVRNYFRGTPTETVELANDQTADAGNGQSFTNLPPQLGLVFAIYAGVN